MGKNRRDISAAAAPTRDPLVRHREGDEAAFREIVGEFQERLVQFFYRLCWDRDRAEDFTQDLFMKLLRGAGRYRPEGRLSTFVFRVATNLWIDHYRTSRPRPRLYSLDQPMRGDPDGRAASTTVSAAAGPMERAIDGEERARLRHALESLTEPHRLVFELAVYQQLPYAEIGDVLNIPVGTVKSRMHNSVRALRSLLGGEDDAAAAGSASGGRSAGPSPFRRGEVAGG